MRIIVRDLGLPGSALCDSYSEIVYVNPKPGMTYTEAVQLVEELVDHESPLKAKCWCGSTCLNRLVS